MTKITIRRAVLERWLDTMQKKGMAEGWVFIALREMREALAQPPQEPAWWPAVENILDEFGLQAIDFVADFKAAQSQPEPVGIVTADCTAEGPALIEAYQPIQAGTTIYTSPPARKPLTKDEIEAS